MKGPPMVSVGRLSPGPTRWPPWAEERLVPETSNLKPHTSLCPSIVATSGGNRHLLLDSQDPVHTTTSGCIPRGAGTSVLVVVTAVEDMFEDSEGFRCRCARVPAVVLVEDENTASGLAQWPTAPVLRLRIECRQAAFSAT